MPDIDIAYSPLIKDFVDRTLSKKDGLLLRFYIIKSFIDFGSIFIGNVVILPHCEYMVDIKLFGSLIVFRVLDVGGGWS